MTDKFARMTYGEREKLKQFADRGEGLRECLIMIAHWQRQKDPISFSRYAAMWAEADIHGDRWNNQEIKEAWPLSEPNLIAPGCSDIGTAAAKKTRHEQA